MSDSSLALHFEPVSDLRSACAKPARVIGEALMWLGGGTLFAATVFVLTALPGLID